VTGLLEGKVALVTGAASGLGLETARLFAEHGAQVIGTDVSDDEGASALGRIDGARYVHADVRSAPELDAAIAVAERDLGKLDVVVANAGIMGRASFLPIEEVTDEDWALVLDVNLGGAFRTFRAAVPALRRAGGGAMSATSSVSGVYATVYRSAYGSSKGGVNALVRGLAVELAPDRIRVNAMCPGSMGTNIRRSLGRTREEIHVPMPDRSVKARVVQDDRDGTAEAARAHLFLCSDLSAYVNGETLVVDGGFSIWNGT
jgi:NAD(P)-dependent dehydrogenase (short-subunit alcohol dehydrogenase family)